MTLLQICQAVADEVGTTRPSSIASSVDADVQKLFRFAKKAGNDLMKSVAWQALRAEQTFTSLAQETQTDILPSDFDRIVGETFWDRSGKVLLSGPISPVQWAGLKAQGYTNTCFPKFAYRGSAILVIPTPSAGLSYAFEYVSNLWALSSGGTGQTTFLADTDTSKIDEELITKAVKLLYLDSNSLPMVSALADFESYLNTLIKNEQPRSRVLVAGDIFGPGRHFPGAPPVSNETYY